MEMLILILLAILIVCVLILIGLVYAQSRKQNDRILMTKVHQQDQQTREELYQKQMRETFQNLNGQIQILRKENALKAQSIQKMQTDLSSMNKVMTNTKMRGNWGEYQLKSLLEIYAGQNPEIFSMQYGLKNGKVADAILRVAGSDKVLCIDSKFPVENYLRIEEGKNQQEFIRLFKMNMKKHIDDIASKYINEQTVDQAILFIPSESIYQFVCGKCTDTLNYALERHVLMTSPTTLVGVIFTLLASTRDFYRSAHIEEIEKNILSLQQDAHRLEQRSQKAKQSLESLVQQFHSISVSASKITKRMDTIIEGREDPE